MSVFRITAERCDVEGGIAIEELAQLLRLARALFDAFILCESPKIEVFGSLSEISRPVKLEERKDGALRGVAVEGIFRSRCSFGRRTRRSPRHELGVGGRSYRWRS